jgi:hypothetical protein
MTSDSPGEHDFCFRHRKTSFLLDNHVGSLLNLMRGCLKRDKADSLCESSSDADETEL